MNRNNWTRKRGSSSVPAMNRCSHQARCQGLGPRPMRSNSSRPIAIVRFSIFAVSSRCVSAAPGGTATRPSPAAGPGIASVVSLVPVLGAADMNEGSFRGRMTAVKQNLLFYDGNRRKGIGLNCVHGVCWLGNLDRAAAEETGQVSRASWSSPRPSPTRRRGRRMAATRSPCAQTPRFSSPRLVGGWPVAARASFPMGNRLDISARERS